MVEYENLSRYYQKLILDLEYEKWTDYLVSVIKKYTSFTTGIDVGCGTGIFTRKLKKSGYKVTGVDISSDMLSVAKDLTEKEKLSINYLQTDMRSLKSFEKVDFITVVNDGLNYVPHKDVKRTFSCFSKCLKKGGVLLFDISTEYKFQNVLSGNMYGDDDEKLSYIWLSEYSSKDKTLDINVTFFEKVGELYKRYEERQIQYAHTQTDIEKALVDSGFEIISITNALGNEIALNEHRLVFTAIKK